MAVYRYLLRCKSCGEKAVVRIGVGTVEYGKFVYPCPYCGGAIHGVFRIDFQTPDAHLETVDAERLPTTGANLENLKAVTVYTDIPVHHSIAGRPLAEGGSAFMSLMKFMGQDSFAVYMTRAHLLQAARVQVLPILRRAQGFYTARSLDRLRGLLSRALDSTVEDPNEAIRELFGMLYAPIQFRTGPLGWLDEIGHIFTDSIAKGQACRETLKQVFEKGSFRHFRKQALAATLKSFEKSDALLPPLAFEYFAPAYSSRWSDFRIFRDDFEDLKVLYVDIFELASRGLAYLGVFLNLTRRNDPWTWADGKNRTIQKALGLTAIEREFVLDETPRLKTLYGNIRRHVRNDIGHYHLYHDVAMGDLVDEEGRRTNFLRFLTDFLGAVRVTGSVMALVDSVTVAEESLGS